MLLALREFVRNVLVIVVMAAFLQLILPPGSMRRYAHLALALVLVLTLLGPLLALTRTSWDLNELLGQAQTQSAWAELKASSELLQQQNDVSLLKTYRSLLGTQLQDVIARMSEVELVTYQIELVEDQQAEDFGRVISIQVHCKQISGMVKPVHQVSTVQIGSGELEKQNPVHLSDWAKEKQRSIQQAIAKHFQLAEKHVQVTIG